MKKKLAAFLLALLMVLGAAPFAAAVVKEAPDITLSDIVGKWKMYSYEIDGTFGYAEDDGLLYTITIRDNMIADYIEENKWGDVSEYKNIDLYWNADGYLLFEIYNYGRLMTYRMVRLDGNELVVSGSWYNDDGTPAVNRCVYRRVAGAAPAVTFASNAKTATVTGDFAGLYARVALILDNGGVSGLYITQAVINPDGTIVIPEFVVPGLTVKGVNVAVVPTLADIQSTTPNVKASAFKMLP